MGTDPAGLGAIRLHELERQLAVICRQAVRATLLASSLSPAVGCGNAPPRRDASPQAAASPSAPTADAAVQPSPEPHAAAAPASPPLPAIFAAETAAPVAPPAAS